MALCEQQLAQAVPDSAAVGSRTRDLLIASPVPYHYTTEPHGILNDTEDAQDG